MGGRNISMKNLFPPTDRQYTYLQANRGDNIGTLWSSMCLDFQSNFGVMRVAPRLILNTGNATETNLALPQSFKEFDGDIWALCGTRIYRNTAQEPNEVFVEDSSSGAKTNYTVDSSDMETFDGRLWASNNDGLYAKVANGSGTGAWSQITATPNAGILQYFRKFDRLYISQGDSSVQSISNADSYASSGDYTITLPTQFVVVSMCETSDSIWIGTINTQDESGRGSIFRWDGISAQATERYYMEANEIPSLVTKNDIPFCMDSNGILSQFTGSSFEEVGRIPFIKTVPNGTSTGTSNLRYVHRHGMVITKNDTILALISNIYEDSTDSVPENVPSGIWEWSKDFGLTHKYAFTYTPRETSTITDFGQNRIWQSGALANMSIGDDSSDRNGTLLAGARYYTDNTTGSSSNYAIFYDDSNNTIQKKGYFVTTWFNSNEIQDKWERLWTVYKRFLNSGDSLVMKYRLYEEAPTYADITWVNTTSFTTTTDITAYGPTATGFDAVVGGEVEFLQGTGSGACVHITSIVNNGGTYTVTIDTAVTGVTTGTGKARFQKWIKLNPKQAQDQVLSYSQFGIGVPNTRIQLKGCMTFLGNDEFHKLALVSNEDITITK